ncbi:hypothetical protein MULP_00684 [Mycobacterium liflandii 128FXT]|uniref:Uncharacterized protein n=1 Tax=Mycobacterium liflandii (strain 128FXT) TaxID=459424 RepID=L7V2M3_MYCL1|nr:hypothetical protein [Mycobacterium ulcerans]AGC60758.1 hypothetical protein MULP_00684 [Mycobacterium liflandii 128FXT]
MVVVLSPSASVGAFGRRALMLADGFVVSFGQAVSHQLTLSLGISSLPLKDRGARWSSERR